MFDEGEGTMQSERQPSYWAAGWATFAGLMLILLGLFHAIAGLAEVVDPDYYATSVSGDYVFKLSSDAWGWIHLIGGIIVFFAGFAIFRGAVWGRTVGVIIAIISAASAFAWLPYAPVSAIAIIAIDIAVIWALTAHGRDVTA
jgi:hypothetical protein